MIEDMAVVHISEAELARDVRGVLEKVRGGAEVIVEQDHQPVAVLRAAAPPRRTIAQALALMPKDSTAAMDAEFALDIAAAIGRHREPLEPPTWE